MKHNGLRVGFVWALKALNHPPVVKLIKNCTLSKPTGAQIKLTRCVCPA